jgi:hypothetical protein
LETLPKRNEAQASSQWGGDVCHAHPAVAFSTSSEALEITIAYKTMEQASRRFVNLREFFTTNCKFFAR